MNTDNTLWQTKLAARLHDPAEKALVLLRDPAGHENGTSRALARLLGLHDIGPGAVEADNDEALVRTLFTQGIPADMYRHIQRADWWAAAADRPQWPMEPVTVTTKKGVETTLQIAPWAQVRWTKQPVLIHPLTGDQRDLGQHGGLSDTDFQDIKRRSFDHVSSLLMALHAQSPQRKTGAKPCSPSGALRPSCAKPRTTASSANSGSCCPQTRAFPTTPSGITST